MDKKGALGPAPSLLSIEAYLAFIVVVISSLVLFSLQSKSIELQIKESKVMTEDHSLLALLKTPINNLRVIDLIMLWLNDDSYKTELDNSIKSLLSLFYNADIDYYLEVKEFRKSIGNKKSEPVTGIELKIPVKNKVATLILEIYIEGVKENSLCFNPLAKKCSLDLNKLCECDRAGFKFIWQCNSCPKGCNPKLVRCN